MPLGSELGLLSADLLGRLPSRAAFLAAEALPWLVHRRVVEGRLQPLLLTCTRQDQ